MKVVPVPVRSDNYAYLLIDEATLKAAVVDPFDVQKVIDAAKKEGVTIGEQVITTHHHADHSGGNSAFVEKFPKAVVYAGSDKAQAMNHLIKNGDTFQVGDNISVKGLATPCHTQDSICFFVEDKQKNQRGVFTGDTLFIAGCGRFFEGNAAEMDKALNDVLGSLPDDTVSYVGHEYTASNVAFSLSVEPENESLQKLKKFCDENEITTGKFTIKDEKEFNPFMRLESPVVQKATGSKERVGVMDALRTMKNNFKA